MHCLHFGSNWWNNYMKYNLFIELIILLHKITSDILLYSTLIDCISTITFQNKCDNKGSTLMPIKTFDGHIFERYIPRSPISEVIHNECDDSLYFHFSDWHILISYNNFEVIFKY